MAGGLVLEIARGYMGAEGRYQAHVIDLEDSDALFAARSLSTMTFVERGKISQDAVDAAGGLEGFLAKDPYHSNSIYFACVDTKSDSPTEPVVATRVIVANQDISNIRLPINEFAAGTPIYGYLRSLPEGSVGEFGALAKKKDTSRIASLVLLREVLGTTCERGMTRLVTGLDPNVWEKAYSKQFAGALSRTQDGYVQTRNVNGPQVPLWLHLPTFVTDQRTSVALLPRRRDRVAGKLINRFMTLDPRIAEYNRVAAEEREATAA